MTGTTILKSGEFPENVEKLTEADRRAAAARPQQGLMLATKNLFRAVGDKMLVRDVSIQVKPGEVLALVKSDVAYRAFLARRAAEILRKLKTDNVEAI